MPAPRIGFIAFQTESKRCISLDDKPIVAI